jgi:exopolyphosphatase/guanosine-5'-triphosphate,3'-diphosphate pyrophosphatase
MEHIASLDLGTNTFRLLIAEQNDNSGDFRPVLFNREITRLGEGISNRHHLSELAMDRGLKTLKAFSEIMKSHNVRRYKAVATSAVRIATNSQDFLSRVNRELGIQVSVISGQEEAGLTLRGVTSVLKGYNGRVVIFDIGGGSTEFIIGEVDGPHDTFSTDLGVVHLTETFIHTDPPESHELEEMETKIKEKVTDLKDFFLKKWPDLQEKDRLLVGTAGTVTTLGAIHLGLTEYDPNLINNLVLKRSDIEEIFDRLTNMKALDRLSIPGLVNGREDIIIPGTLIVRKIMEAFGFDSLTVSDSGLLEGILYYLVTSEIGDND